MLASFLGYILYIIHNTAHDPNIVYNNMNSHFLSGGLFYYTLLHGTGDTVAFPANAKVQHTYPWPVPRPFPPLQDLEELGMRL